MSTVQTETKAPFNPAQVKWLEQVGKSTGGDTPEKYVEKALAAQSLREDFLKKSLGKIGGSSERIAAAQGFKITNEKEVGRIWKKVVSKDMPWLAQDWKPQSRFDWDVQQDHEVDTKEDVGEGTREIPDATIDALTDALAEILEVQTEMLQQYDQSGNRLFSDADIRRELWTPLVRSGLIPENMVPDKFSEEAVAFKGGSEIYDDKISTYSKKSTGHEKLIHGLKIGKDVFELGAGCATSMITMINAPTITQNNVMIRTGVDANGNPVDVAALKTENLKLQEQLQFAQMAGVIGSGGLELTSEFVKTKDEAKQDPTAWAGFANKVFKLMQKIVTASISPLTTVNNETEMSGSGASERGGHADMIGDLLQGSLTLVRVGPTLFQIAMEKDSEKQRAAIKELIGELADAVGFAVQAYSDKLHKDAANSSNPQNYLDAETMKNLGVKLSIALNNLTKIDDVYQALKKRDHAGVCAVLLGDVLKSVLVSESGDLFKAVRTEYTKEETSKLSQAESMYTLRQNVVGKEQQQDIQVMTGSSDISQNVSKSIDEMQKSVLKNAPKRKTIDGDEQARLKMEIFNSLQEKYQAKADKKLEEHFTSKENVDKMFEKFDEQLKTIGYDSMMAEAHPDVKLEGQTETDAEEALAAIDRAIEATSELRAKVEILNSVTAATVGIIASIVPGTGAVVAAQKVAFTIYALVQASKAHNAWCDSMEKAFDAQSAYFTAIRKTTLNARITVSQHSVKLAFESLKLGAQVGRCFDPTGGATIAAAGLSLTQSLVEFGYKMHKEREIDSAWKTYKDAIEHPGNRKRARKAMRTNSTLAKCAIAYGACMQDDPIAKEAVRNCGLSPEVLADDKDVCKKLLSYLENELRDDPVVLHVEKQKKPWYPAERPLLTFASWSAYKAAAMTTALPRLNQQSAKTPAIDSLLAKLAAPECWGGKKAFAEVLAELDPAETRKGKPKDVDHTATEEYKKAKASEEILEKLQTAFLAYMPMAGNGSSPHAEMTDIVRTYSMLVKLNLDVVKESLTPYVEPKPQGGDKPGKKKKLKKMKRIRVKRRPQTSGDSSMPSTGGTTKVLKKKKKKKKVKEKETSKETTSQTQTTETNEGR